MSFIKQLSEDLIKKIAAGEVIERPASVVKELVENSIDAGSTKIEIEVERAGKYIKISDNGSGIHPDDFDLLFTKHATSKINNFDDLWNISTLGFRGEALASISAISKIICRSKYKDFDHAFEAKYINGKLEKKSYAMSNGTIFEIDDLFFNVPARQKFLKSESTEFGHIYDVVISEALSNPQISFTLFKNKNASLKSSGNGDLRQTIYEILGNDLNDKLIQINNKNHFVTLSGFISALETYRSDRKSIFIFINNRPVKCQIISKAITSSFEGLLPNGKFPVVVLKLDFKPKFVDVNVHPTKKEVRYSNSNEVYNFVLHSIQNIISDYYKKKYEEKSVYKFPSGSLGSMEVGKQGSKETENLEDLSSTSRLIENTEFLIPHSQLSELNPQPQILNPLFTTSNLKCYITYLNEPVANIVKAGNKTIFEVGARFDDDLQIVFSGEVIGDGEYQKDFFDSLSDLATNLYKTHLGKEIILQKKLINEQVDSNEEKKVDSRKKPPETLLYKIWERDNWTCVYCSKQLLDPKIVKEAIPKSKDAFVNYINNSGEEITVHLLKEHAASYDHYLPVSKLPQFNFEEENLFACCFSCNRKKSDSMSLKEWIPNRKNNWNKVLEVAGLCFDTPKSFSEATSTLSSN